MNPLSNVISMEPDEDVDIEDIPDDVESLTWIPEKVTCQLELGVDDLGIVNASAGSKVS